MTDLKKAIEKGMRKVEQGKLVNKPPEEFTPRPRGHRLAGVKNKAPAPVQITAEQLLREAQEHAETPILGPKQTIGSEDELKDFRARKRQEFENAVRKNRLQIGAWVKYAQWEASQKEFDRARSIWERALDVDYRNVSLWLKYAEMEMKGKFIAHARNLFDRAVQLLPRVDQFWYKYSFMEEMLGEVATARQIYERWMAWFPDEQAWNTYINFELRHNNIDKARAIYVRLVQAHPDPKTFIKWAKFESKNRNIAGAREVYQRAIQSLGEEANNEELYISFAKFEEYHKEFERARVIYQYALDHVPKHRAEQLYATYTAFEKQFGDKQGIEEVILSKRRFQYEEELKQNPRNYDTWFDYIRLEEAKGDKTRIREVYERAIGALPLVNEKIYWQRYIYLWINFALYEELEAKDLDRARKIYEKLLEVIPHKQFTFASLWLLAAHFEIRCMRLPEARKILGRALGTCPRERIFKGYIELETQLGEWDRVRRLFEKYVEWAPQNCSAWARFAEMEASLAESERARAIYELAISQEILDQPELIWKSYIDFEIKSDETQRVRELYVRLLQRTKHVKVWISRALFEAGIKQIDAARQVFQEANAHFKSAGDAKEERALLLEAWLDFERNLGTPETLKAVTDMMPRKIKKRRELKAEDGTTLGFEEYHDYLFPDEENKAGNLKILEMARKWKKTKAAGEA